MAIKSKRRPASKKKKSPRGLMPTPPEVEEFLQKVMKERPHSPEAEQWQRDAFNLQYYFGEADVVVCRESSKGLEVLAVGYEELHKLYSQITEEERSLLKLEFPDPW